MYRNRIRSIAPCHFEPLRDTYLSTFDVYSTVDRNEEGFVVPGPGMRPCTAFILAHVAATKGVSVKGVTSERTRRGRFICETMPDGSPRASHRIVYVGAFNYFTSHARSRWSLVAQDKIYLPDPPDPGDTAQA